MIICGGALFAISRMVSRPVRRRAPVDGTHIVAGAVFPQSVEFVIAAPHVRCHRARLSGVPAAEREPPIQRPNARIHNQLLPLRHIDVVAHEAKRKGARDTNIAQLNYPAPHRKQLCLNDCGLAGRDMQRVARLQFYR